MSYAHAMILHHGQSRLGLLIDKSKELEVMASKIQIAPKRIQSKTYIDRLRSEYHDWYAQALDLLPDEFQERFRDEYEGGIFTAKIKKFLEAPGAVSSLHTPENPIFDYWQHSYEGTFLAPLLGQRQILVEAQKKLEGSGSLSENVLLIERICRNFPEFLSPLQERGRGRSPFIVEDEYDAQDALHGLLRIFFDDVRPEDYVPELAGAKSRVDFLLKEERIVVEVKMTRRNLGTREIGEQLITDIARYKAHPDCGALVAFVYDPDRRIKNRRALEVDLTKRHDELGVYVYVAQ